MGKYKVEAYISRVIYNYKAGRTSDKDLVSFNRRIGNVVQSKINRDFTPEEALYAIDLLSKFFREEEEHEEQSYRDEER